MTGNREAPKETHDTPLVPDEWAVLVGLEGTTLEGEFSRAISRLAIAGIKYPVGYYDTLIQKYQKSKVLSPYMLIDVGNPSIRKHKHYQDVLQNAGDLLDYGCGTGDDLRALVADGYPQKQVRGFDINWDSINLGFDLYLDREVWANHFFVARSLPFPPPSFDFVYSGVVLHNFLTKKGINKYIANACAALKPGGVFFGYTLGSSNEWVEWGRKFLKLLSAEQLHAVLSAAGFENIEVDSETQKNKVFLWFYAEKV